MPVIRHIILLISSIAVIWLAGHQIPQMLGIQPEPILKDLPPSEDSLQGAYATPAVAGQGATANDSAEALINGAATKPLEEPVKVLTVLETLEQTLKPFRQIKPRIAKPWNTWYLGKGIALPWYYTQIADTLKSRGCGILDAQEFSGRQSSILISWKCAEDTDTTKLSITHGEEYLDSTSKMGVVFQVEKMDVPSLKALQELKIPYGLLINPFDTSKSLFTDLGHLKNYQSVIWLPMEPREYPYIKPGPGTILIHHTSAEIGSILDKAFQQLPQAVGAANFYGSRALENPPLLRTLLKNLARHDLFFLEIDGERGYRTQDICLDLQTQCYFTGQINAKGRIPAYLNSKLLKARKTGKALTVVPLSEAVVREVEKIIPVARAQGTTFKSIADFFATPQRGH